MDHLDELGARSIYTLHKVFAQLEVAGLLWSFDKDSSVTIWLARKDASWNDPPASLITQV